MTRDEAIAAVEALRLRDPGEPEGHRDGGVRNLVDTLAALGVLKLDEPLPDSQERVTVTMGGGHVVETQSPGVGGDASFLENVASAAQKAADNLMAPTVPCRMPPSRLSDRSSIISIETNDVTLIRTIEKLANESSFIDLFGKRWFVGSLSASGTAANYMLEAELVQVVEDEKAATIVRCEPPLEHQEKRWHWLHHPQEGIVAWRLKTMIKEQKTLIKGWGHPINRSITFSIVAQAERGWRYVAPCEEPASERGDEVTERSQWECKI